MSRKIATKSYELYLQENPGSKMTKAEYDAKYHADAGHGKPAQPGAHPPGEGDMQGTAWHVPPQKAPEPAPASGVKAPPPVEKAKPMPLLQPSRQEHSPHKNDTNVVSPDEVPVDNTTIPVNQNRVNKDKGFKALLDYAGQGKIKSSKDASTLIHHMGYNEKEFADYMFQNLGNGTTVDQIKNFEDLGVLPHSYVARRLNWGLHQKHVPPKYYDHYKIPHADRAHSEGPTPEEQAAAEAAAGKPPTKAARMTKLLGDIELLEVMIEKEAAEDYKTYKQEHPGTHKAPSDPMFKPAIGQTKPHLSHEDMQKLPEAEHERLAAEHSAHAQAATKSTHEARKNNDLDKMRSHRDLANKHDDASYMHRAYAYANTRKQQIPQDQRAKHLQNAERTHKDLSK